MEGMEYDTESLNSADWFPAPQAAFQERNYDADFRALCFTGTIIMYNYQFVLS
jgi:hypothetical protein